MGTETVKHKRPVRPAPRPGVGPTATFEDRMNSLVSEGRYEILTWAGINSALFPLAITEVLANGGTIQFGITRKSNALTLRIFYDGAGETFYLASTGEAAEALRTLAGISAPPEGEKDDISE